MTDIVQIDDPGDPRLAPFRRLNDAAHRRAVESPGPFGRGRYVIEGWLALERAVRLHADLVAVLVVDRAAARAAALLGPIDVAIYRASPPVVAEVVGFDLHRGVVAVAGRRLPATADTVTARARRLLVIEGVTDGENLGALFRTAAAFGVDGVVVDPRCPDPLSRRVVRVSVGHVLAVPWARAEAAAVMRCAGGEGRTTLALTPGGEVDLHDLAVPEGPWVLAVGSEGAGLSPEALEAAATRVRIGMAGGVDSLNVASAAAVALWHLSR